MKAAILLLTCGRPEMTAQTWKANLSEEKAGYPFDVFWFDNGSSDEDFLPMLSLSEQFRPEWFHYSDINMGIAIGINRMMDVAFKRGYDAVLTMGNDIIEPDNYLLDRVQAAIMIPNTGVVAVPVVSAHLYSEKEENGIRINEGGQLIGNFLITRAAYLTIGLFNTEYGIYGPLDLDYCDRCRAAGLRHYYLAGKMAQHLGTHDANPEQYQQAKKESLAKSWQQYTFNTHKYREGENLYQYGLGPDDPAPGGVGNL